MLGVGHFVWDCEGLSRKCRTELKITAVFWQLDILCGCMGVSAGSDVLNFMYFCVFVVGHIDGSVRGSAGSSDLIGNVLLCVGS